MAITLAQAKALKVGQELWSTRSFNRKGQPHMIRINGAVKVWECDPDRAQVSWKRVVRDSYDFHERTIERLCRVQVPWKHGLYDHGYITQDNLGDWCLTKEEALASRA